MDKETHQGQDKMIECTNYRAINKANLLGYATIRVPKWKCSFKNIAYCQKEGARWISFPTKTFMKDGKECRYSEVRLDEDIYKPFCEAAKKAIEAFISKDTQESIEDVQASIENKLDEQEFTY